MVALDRLLPSAAHHLVGFTLYSCLVAVLIVQMLQLRHSLLWQWLDYRPVRFLGTISYPIYLYHIWGLGLGRWLTMLTPLGQVVAGTLFTLGGAVASYYFVERPFLRLKVRFEPRRQTSDGQESTRPRPAEGVSVA
jgi:peptidoglycan/LPS O-acetylase OafA/YrhL